MMTDVNRIVGSMLVLLLALVCTVILPGLVAAYGGVFYQNDLSHKLPASAVNQLHEYEENQKALNIALTNLEKQLSDGANTSKDTKSILEYRQILLNRKLETKLPVYVIPFHLNPQLLLWPTIYTVLGWLIFLFKPRFINYRRILFSKDTWIVGVILYVVYEWPLWVRNFILSNDGRVVYAYPNADIHFSSFIGQEMVIFGFLVLTAYLWNIWLINYRNVADSNRLILASPTIALSDAFARQVANHFLTWQVMSVLLALGYLFFTNFFWRFVAVYNDQRYLLSAILAHLIWAVTWFLISLPLFHSWRTWLYFERDLRVRLLEDGLSVEEKTFRSELLKEIRPMSTTGVSVSGVAGLISFVFPIVQAFVK